MISVSNLEKSYGSLHAVAGVSFEIAAGEIVGLLGHNGAGKTTIMKILTGYLEPSNGTVTVGGSDVIADRLEVQKQIGYLPESAPLYPEMLVQEYLMMMAELRLIPEADRQKRVSEAVRATGLENRLVQTIGTLSKGFKQRVGIAQAILHKPKVLVLDEPTNGLDPVQILEIRELIQHLAKDTTILLSTHILPEIEAVCNRVIVLIDGHLSKDAKLDAMLSSDVVRVGLEEDASDVIKEIGGVEGVADIVKEERNDGLYGYRVRCKEGAKPVPAILDRAVNQGWKVAEIGSARPSLEVVFQELMYEHVSKVRKNKTSESEN